MKGIFVTAFIFAGAVPGFCQTPHRSLASIFDSKLAFYLPSPDSAPASIGQVLNATGEATTVGQNTWVEVKGSNLANTTTDWGSSPSFAQGKLPTSVGGVSATVNNQPAFIYYVSPTQVNILTPLDNALGAGIPVTLITPNGTTSSTTTFTQTPVGLFTFNFSAPYYPAAIHGLTNCPTPYGGACLLGPPSLYPGLSTPAQPGELIVLYGNGFGLVSQPLQNGGIPPQIPLPTNPVITIGGLQAKVDYAAIVAPGEYQFNVEVPLNCPNGDNLIVVSYNGAVSQDKVYVTVQK